MLVTLCPWQCLHTWSAPLCRWDLTHITHIETPIVLILSTVKSTDNDKTRGDLKLKFIRKWHEKCFNSFTFTFNMAIYHVKSRVILRSQRTLEAGAIIAVLAGELQVSPGWRCSSCWSSSSSGLAGSPCWLPELS